MTGLGYDRYALQEWQFRHHFCNAPRPVPPGPRRRCPPQLRYVAFTDAATRTRWQSNRQGSPIHRGTERTPFQERGLRDHQPDQPTKSGFWSQRLASGTRRVDCREVPRLGSLRPRHRAGLFDGRSTDKYFHLLVYGDHRFKVPTLLGGRSAQICARGEGAGSLWRCALSRRTHHAPRSWTEMYYHVKHWTKMPAGGHFAALEQPGPLANEIREFFRPLRSA